MHPALERGYTPDSMVEDEAYRNDGPANANKRYDGEISLRTALAASKNTVAWNLFKELTPKVGLSYLKEMGFAKIVPEDEQLTSALGGFTNGVSPMEMTAAYATLENDGNYRTPTCIMKITDADGNEIISTDQEETCVYKSTAARMVTDMLTTAVTEGTGAGLGVTDMPSAEKPARQMIIKMAGLPDIRGIIQPVSG